MIIGPHCAGWFDPRAWASTVEVQNSITLEVMRVVLATGLFAIGVELPKAYLAEHWKSLVAMVITTMAFGWVICAGELMVIYIHVYTPILKNCWIHSHLKVSSTVSFLNYSALVISACLTPTDSILAAAIIGGKFAIKDVPGHIR